MPLTPFDNAGGCLASGGIWADEEGGGGADEVGGGDCRDFLFVGIFGGKMWLDEVLCCVVLAGLAKPISGAGQFR